MSKLNHIALVMDGNRRWADAQRVSRVRGHKEGIFAIERTIAGCVENDIEYVTLFAFSTENWNRSRFELRYLTRLMYRYLLLLRNGALGDWVLNRVRISFIGRRQDFGKRIEVLMDELEHLTRHNTECHVIIAASYGGQDEIVDAVNSAIESGARSIKRSDIMKHLYLPDVPFPDLIVRTGKEMRLSNFLTWQSCYSEFLFIDKFWPEIIQDDFAFFTSQYLTRDRKFGK